MAGRVGDDELALVGREVAVGDVDGDALLALGHQPVGEQGEVDAPVAERRGALDRLELVLVDGARVVEQPPDERRLAVVDRAHRDEAQELLLLVAREVGLDVLLDERVDGHQKYPSRFLASIDPSSSKSMRRPCRSLKRVRSISRMSFGTVSASDSRAPVSG